MVITGNRLENRVEVPCISSIPTNATRSIRFPPRISRSLCTLSNTTRGGRARPTTLPHRRPLDRCVNMFCLGHHTVFVESVHVGQTRGFLIGDGYGAGQLGGGGGDWGRGRERADSS